MGSAAEIQRAGDRWCYDRVKGGWMARGRMIAKTLSTSQRFARLHEKGGKLAEFCQSLYPLLLAHADDFGRLAGDEFTVKMVACPASPRKLPDIAKALALLHQVNLVVWYEAEGRKCLQIVDFDKYQTGLHKRTGSQFPPPSGNFREIPSEGKGREGKGTEENGTEGKAADAAVLASVPESKDPIAPEGKLEAVVVLWNELTEGTKLPRCRGLSDRLRAHIRARMPDHGLGDLRDAFTKAARSAFANGTNDRGWVMTLDWIVKSPDNLRKILEGQYDDRGVQEPVQKADPYGHIPPCRTHEECINKRLGKARAEAS
jgi:hypothetical protein